MAIDQSLVDIYLDRAVEEFDSNRVSTQLIRRLAKEAPEMFVTAALRHLNGSRHSNALWFLSIMLRQQKVFLDRLSNPAESKHKSIDLFQHVFAVDPTFDVKLAQQLPDRVGANHHEALRGARAARTLEILDATSPGRRLLPILGHLVESDDPRTREKAILFVGRRVQSPNWAERQLKRPDDRVRANAIESLWGLNTPEATNLLETCASDKTNRVAGNALVGLHLAGRKGVEEEVTRMANESSPRFRSTAAWAMGQIGKMGNSGDVSFLPRLAELVKDEESMVRGAALRSLIEIRRAQVSKAEAADHPVADVVIIAPSPEMRASLEGSNSG